MLIDKEKAGIFISFLILEESFSILPLYLLLLVFYNVVNKILGDFKMLKSPFLILVCQVFLWKDIEFS